MEVQIKRLDQYGYYFEIGDGCRARALVWLEMRALYRNANRQEIPGACKTIENIYFQRCPP
ncbi:hypothetical protein V7111_25410 [Neobacillus niacini]|uniref:hypothetical protein n=1 Tax=Neobacillus niacini TaxID=86668 RepID=UPI0030028621